MYFLLKIGIFQPAMLVYQRVNVGSIFQSHGSTQIPWAIPTFLVAEAQLERAAVTLYERERSTCHSGEFCFGQQKSAKVSGT